MKNGFLPKGRLIKNIIPNDEVGKRSPKFYSAGAEIEITPLGCYVAHGKGSLAGWVYENIKKREINKQLKQGIDFELI